MSDEERRIAERLIEASIKNGRLNLTLLRQKTSDEAEKEAKSFWIRGDQRLEKTAEYITDLTIATREDLGIIPHEDWGHSVSDIIGRLAVAEYKPGNGLACHYKNGEPLDVKAQPALEDPTISLKSQGVTCQLPTSPSPVPAKILTAATTKPHL